MDRQLELILAEGFLDGVDQRSVTELRSARAECQGVETQLSYLRRMVQGRHDIVAGEVERRRRGGDPVDVHALVEQLPEILSDRVRSAGPGRLPISIEAEEPSGALADRLQRVTAGVPIDSPDEASEEQLADVAEQLAELEAEISGLRRAVFDRIDALEAELTRRYRDGLANVDDLLADAAE